MTYKSTILIVDDEPVGRQLIDAILYKEGYNLEFAENGQEAFDKAIALNPDLILMDVMMPEIDGFEVCQKLRTDSTMTNVPIILITALDDIDSRIRGLEAGADDYISKPFNRLELLARVKIITRLNRYRNAEDGTTEKPKEIKEKEEKNDETSISINIANQILDSLLTPKELIKDIFPDFFVLRKQYGNYKSNLYWVFSKSDKVFISFINCNSSNITDALMSILLLTYLKTIAKNNEDLPPNILLNNLHNELKSKLNKSIMDIKSKDYVNISLCIYNKSTHALQFSGTKNPLILIKDDELIEIVGDDIDFCNIELEEADFTQQNIDVSSGDKLYFLSNCLTKECANTDERINLSMIKKYIFDSQDESMEAQKNILENNINFSDGIPSKCNDIVILGIKI